MSDEPVHLAEKLAAAAQDRIEATTFGIVGGIVAADGELHFFDGPPDSVDADSPAEAWAQVQTWVAEEAAMAGGLALNLDLVEPGDGGSSYEVVVEGRNGESIDFIHPYRRKRLWGWDFSAGRIYTEPDEKHLDF